MTTFGAWHSTSAQLERRAQSGASHACTVSMGRDSGREQARHVTVAVLFLEL